MTDLGFPEYDSPHVTSETDRAIIRQTRERVRGEGWWKAHERRWKSKAQPKGEKS